MSYKYANTYIDAQGNVTVDEYEVPYWSLESSEVAIVLLICKGVITLEEGVNITRLPAEHLINEAEAWAVAGNV